jgi:hypothetical protein
MPRIASLVVALAVLLTGACRGGTKADAGRSERERDSVIGQSTLPGARGVQGALNASDSARARGAALDSAAAAP